MNGMIEKQGDGVKLNWPMTVAIVSILLGVLGSGMVLIREIQDMSSTMEQVRDDLTEFKLREAAMEARLRILEQGRAADVRDLANALSLLARIDERLERLEQRIPQ